jgi:hypothetical protein
VLHLALPQTLLFSGALLVFAQADLQEHKQYSAAEPNRHQHDCQQLASESANQSGTQRSSDNEHGS